jgi:glutaredoxin 3
MAKVVIYTTDWCSYCRAAKRLFDSRKVVYEEIDLTDDDAGRDALKARTGRQTVPQIFIGDVHVGGFDDLRALDQRGGLDPLLQS